jgi:hypothetical protein
MGRRWLIPAVLASVLAWSGCSIMTHRSAVADARLVYRTLRQNEQMYQQALAAERETLRRLTAQAQEQAGDPGPLREEIEGVQSRFDHLHSALQHLPVGSTTRRELLGPILRQLEEEHAALLEIERRLNAEESLSAGSGEDMAVRPVPENLFTPVIQRIQREYQFAKPRVWRGQPLTV